ncbi:hypothetical protein JDV02_010654 [Purpureocillium takamizusanense]|uniref:Luciferase domain-containing protein n=1 Tax=Purpureocillium takamizusanense TaxID=2060973 RepID=A0A9Q8QPB5_9HYPO|nr:uncharacterized protein JDV02_010654 [Purpureocillium takamizusanense]UNI24939.1 hypothetical protein JDV02_010654 [Purpureocillium takamizusanense]
MSTAGGYATALVAAASATLLLVAYRDYRAYIALGPHGLPDTLWGWYTQLKLSRYARKDTTVPAPYDIEAEKERYGPHATESFLQDSSSLRQLRRGVRPTIPGFVAPQRQLSALASPEMKEQMNDFLRALVAANPAVLQHELSVLEGLVPAVQLKSHLGVAARPVFLKATKGEMIHVHPPDGSTHLTLSLADSRSVIEQGWGQRHRLSGGLLGWGYTLVYAPRDEREFDVWKGLVWAAARYCCAGIQELKHP